MRVIITGAGGFIGRALAEELALSGHEVLAVSRKAPAAEGRSFPERIELLQGDLLNLTSGPMVSAGWAEADCWIQAAGQAHTAQNAATAPLFRANNVEACVRSLELTRQLGVRRYILISSVSALSRDPDDLYAASKRVAEERAVAYCNAWGIPWTIVRPVAVYGEGDSKGNVARLIRLARKGWVPLPAGGKAVKNLLYIGNLRYMVRTILEQASFRHAVLTARDKETLTLGDIVEALHQGGRAFRTLPLPDWAGPAAARLLKAVQQTGALKGIHAGSLQRIGDAADFPVPPDTANGRLLNSLPFRMEEGLAHTLDYTWKVGL